MKKTKGATNPQVVNKIIKEILERQEEKSSERKKNSPK